MTTMAMNVNNKNNKNKRSKLILGEKELEFLDTIENGAIRHGFIASMTSHTVEGDVKAIKEQIPSLSEVSSDDLVGYILRKDGEHFNLEGYSECDAPSVHFGSYMWYLCFDTKGFYWCGNPMYAENEWDNEDILYVTPKAFEDDESKERMAKKMLQIFYKHPAVKRGSWADIGGSEGK